MSVNDLLLLAFGTGDFEQNALINSRVVRLRQYLETHAAFATVMVNAKDHIRSIFTKLVSEDRKMPKMTQPKTPEKLGKQYQNREPAPPLREADCRLVRTLAYGSDDPLCGKSALITKPRLFGVTTGWGLQE
jgi:hypothetical protein